MLSAVLWMDIEAIAAVAKICKDGAKILDLCQKGDDVVTE